MSAGSLDTTFGKGGVASPFLFAARDVAVQADGKIVMVGERRHDFALARVNADGTPDTTFGAGGLVTTDFGGKDHDEAQQVAIQQDGKIVVGGRAVDDAPNHARWCFARYNPDGSLDPTFGNGGKDPVSGFDYTDGIVDLHVQNDGKIIFATDTATFDGFITKFINYNVVVGALRSDGSIDPHFGDYLDSGGRRGNVTTDLGEEDFPEAMAVQPDGRIVVAVHQGFGNDDEPFVLLRYTRDGRLDKSFDGDGIASAETLGSSLVTSVAVAPDGEIYEGGMEQNHLFVIQFDPSGHLEHFSKGGIFMKLSPAGVDVADQIFVPQPGKVLVVGRIDSTGSDGGTSQAVAVQFHTDGTIDPSFGSNGIAKFNMGTLAQTGTAALGANGKIVIAGSHFDRREQTTSLVRFTEATPVVSLFSQNSVVTEGAQGANGPSIIFRRDAAYNFPTTIHFTVGGTATPLADYTGLLASFSPFGKSIMIPAGQSEFAVPVNIVDDQQLEPTEQITVTGMPDSSFKYALSAQRATRALNRGPAGNVGGVGAGLLENTATITILDNDAVHVNRAVSPAMVRQWTSVSDGLFSDKQFGDTTIWI